MPTGWITTKQEKYYEAKDTFSDFKTRVGQVKETKAIIDWEFKDIEEIDEGFDFLIMFGCDKNLKDSVRIERFAEKNGEKISSGADLEKISTSLDKAGIENCISDISGHYLCNEAYWYALQRFNGKAVFIHIPTIKNLDCSFIAKMKEFVICINQEK